MKRFAIPCAVTLVSLAGLVGCAGGDDTAADPKPGIVSGYVTAGAPVTGAQIRVVDDEGHVLARGRRPSTSDGFFFVDVPRLPREFRVVAQGGRLGGRPVGGELTSAATRFESPGKKETPVDLNPATSISDTYARNHEDMDRAEAERRVKGHLAISRSVDLGHDLTVSDKQFSGHAFAREARGNGGVAATVRRTAAQVDGPRRHPFRGVGPNPNDLGNPIDTFLDELAGGAGKKIGGEAAGWILSELGIFDSSKQLDDLRKELDEVNNRLMAVQRQLADLKLEIDRLEALVGESVWNGLFLHLPIDEIDHGQNLLMQIAGAKDPGERAALATELKDYLNKSTSIQTSLENFHNRFQGVGDTTKLIPGYGQKVRLKLAAQGQRWLGAEYSESLSQMYDAVNAREVQGLAMIVEWEHSKAEQGAKDYDQQIKAWGKVAADKVDQYKGYAADDVKTVARPLTQAVIDTRTNVVWSDMRNPPGGLQSRGLTPWIRYVNTGACDDACQKALEDAGGGDAGLSAAQGAAAANRGTGYGWSLPTRGDVLDLLAGPPTDSGDAGVFFSGTDGNDSAPRHGFQAMVWDSGPLIGKTPDRENPIQGWSAGDPRGWTSNFHEERDHGVYRDNQFVYSSGPARSGVWTDPRLPSKYHTPQSAGKPVCVEEGVRDVVTFAPSKPAYVHTYDYDYNTYSGWSGSTSLGYWWQECQETAQRWNVLLRLNSVNGEPVKGTDFYD